MGISVLAEAQAEMRARWGRGVNSEEEKGGAKKDQNQNLKSVTKWNLRVTNKTA